MARFEYKRDTDQYAVFQSDGSDGIPEFAKIYVALDDPKAKKKVLEFAEVIVDNDEDNYTVEQTEDEITVTPKDEAK